MDDKRTGYMKTSLWMAGCGAALVLGSAPLHAETLRDALIAAYQTNPTLNAARAQQRWPTGARVRRSRRNIRRISSTPPTPSPRRRGR
jgi:hypothetical protein